MRTTISRCGLVLAATLLIGACGSDDTPASDPTAPDRGAGPELLAADVERVEPSADAPVDALVSGSNDAGFELQRHLPADGGNVVFSPASLSTAFAMASAGAGDEATATAFGDVFGLPEGDATHDAMNALLAELVPDNTGDADEATELSVANSGWAMEGEPIGEAFLDTLARHYGAGLYTTDFAGDNEASRQAINDWVAEATRDRLPELIGDGQLPEDTLYTLVNAIYLDATWQDDFSPESTGPEPFTLADGSKHDVEMMFDGHRSARFSVEGDTTVVALPYGDGEFEMTIAMPTDLATFVAGLDDARWSRLTARLGEGEIDLTMPKWETSTALDLGEPLTEMGIDVPGGNLSKVADSMRIGAVLQAADITVDEAGTEAAAATAIIGEATAAPPEEPPVEITIDRPFFYTIEHAPTGMILFAGQVHDPAA